MDGNGYYKENQTDIRRLFLNGRWGIYQPEMEKQQVLERKHFGSKYGIYCSVSGVGCSIQPDNNGAPARHTYLG